MYTQKYHFLWYTHGCGRDTTKADIEKVLFFLCLFCCLFGFLSFDSRSLASRPLALAKDSLWNYVPPFFPGKNGSPSSDAGEESRSCRSRCRVESQTLASIRQHDPTGHPIPSMLIGGPPVHPGGAAKIPRRVKSPPAKKRRLRPARHPNFGSKKGSKTRF